MAAYFFTRYRNTVLLFASLVFYAWGELHYLPLLGFYIVFNYAWGLLLAARPRAKPLLVVGVLTNLGLLLHYKYVGFLLTQLNWPLAAIGVSSFAVPSIALPLGISFFTFQGISYLVDIHRGDVQAQRNPIDFAMYKAMFPQLIAGPIVRYKSIAARVNQRCISAFRLRFGVQLFIIGLGQKVLIANSLALPVDQIYALPAAELTMATAWLAAIGYTLQIFFDFAGYSNMAIGLAHMMGFSFPRNFNRPYAAQSITDFWRRWHMTLSAWFRDYVYIPLGGNRGGGGTTARNLMIVFVLCGFWHGAAWTFLAWGVLHGLALMAERGRLGRMIARLPRPGRHAYLLFLVVLAWVLFRAESLGQAAQMLAAMAGFAPGDPLATPLARYLDLQVAIALVLGSILAVAWMPRGRRWLPQASAHSPVLALGRDVAVYLSLLLVLAASVAVVASGAYNPFIYYRF